MCWIRIRKRFFIRINKRRRLICNVFWRIGVYIRRKYYRVIIRWRVWRVWINKWLCWIKWWGRFWYYRICCKWRRFRKLRFVICIKCKWCMFKWGCFGKWIFRYKKKCRWLVRWVICYICYCGCRMWVRSKGRRRRRYFVKNCRGRWIRVRRVCWYRWWCKYNFRFF